MEATKLGVSIVLEPLLLALDQELFDGVGSLGVGAVQARKLLFESVVELAVAVSKELDCVSMGQHVLRDFFAAVPDRLSAT